MIDMLGKKALFSLLVLFAGMFLINSVFATVTCVASDTAYQPIELVGDDQKQDLTPAQLEFYGTDYIYQYGQNIKATATGTTVYNITIDDGTDIICRAIPMGKYAKVTNSSGSVIYYQFVNGTPTQTANKVTSDRTTCTTDMPLEPCIIDFKNRTWVAWKDKLISYVVPSNYCINQITGSSAKTGVVNRVCGGKITISVDKLSIWHSFVDDVEFNTNYTTQNYSESDTSYVSLNLDSSSDDVEATILNRTLIKATWESNTKDTKIGLITIYPSDIWDQPLVSNIDDVSQNNSANQNNQSADVISEGKCKGFLKIFGDQEILYKCDGPGDIIVCDLSDGQLGFGEYTSLNGKNNVTLYGEKMTIDITGFPGCEDPNAQTDDSGNQDNGSGAGSQDATPTVSPNDARSTTAVGKCPNPPYNLKGTSLDAGNNNYMFKCDDKDESIVYMCNIATGPLKEGKSIKIDPAKTPKLLEECKAHVAGQASGATTATVTSAQKSFWDKFWIMFFDGLLGEKKNLVNAPQIVSSCSKTEYPYPVLFIAGNKDKKSWLKFEKENVNICFEDNSPNQTIKTDIIANLKTRDGALIKTEILLKVKEKPATHTILLREINKGETPNREDFVLFNCKDYNSKESTVNRISFNNVYWLNHPAKENELQEDGWGFDKTNSTVFPNNAELYSIISDLCKDEIAAAPKDAQDILEFNEPDKYGGSASNTPTDLTFEFKEKRIHFASFVDPDIAVSSTPISSNDQSYCSGLSPCYFYRIYSFSQIKNVDHKKILWDKWYTETLSRGTIKSKNGDYFFMQYKGGVKVVFPDPTIYTVETIEIPLKNPQSKEVEYNAITFPNKPKFSDLLSEIASVLGVTFTGDGAPTITAQANATDKCENIISKSTFIDATTISNATDFEKTIWFNCQNKLPLSYCRKTAGKIESFANPAGSSFTHIIDYCNGQSSAINSLNISNCPTDYQDYFYDNGMNQFCFQCVSYDTDDLVVDYKVIGMDTIFKGRKVIQLDSTLASGFANFDLIKKNELRNACCSKDSKYCASQGPANNALKIMWGAECTTRQNDCETDFVCKKPTTPATQFYYCMKQNLVGSANCIYDDECSSNKCDGGDATTYGKCAVSSSQSNVTELPAGGQSIANMDNCVKKYFLGGPIPNYSYCCLTDNNLKHKLLIQNNKGAIREYFTTDIASFLSLYPEVLVKCKEDRGWALGPDFYYLNQNYNVKYWCDDIQSYLVQNDVTQIITTPKIDAIPLQCMPA